MKYTKAYDIDGHVQREMRKMASDILGNIPGHRESEVRNLRDLNDLHAHYNDYRNRILREEQRLGRKLSKSERLAIIATSTAYAKSPTKKKSRNVVPKTPRKKATRRLQARHQRTTNVLTKAAAVRRRLDAALKRLSDMDDNVVDKVLAALEKRS